MIEVTTTESPEKYKYGRYFLATEEETENETSTVVAEPKFNTKLINIKPSNRGKDFTVDAEEPPVEEPADNTVDGSEDFQDDMTDYTSDNPEIPQEDTSDVAPTVDDPNSIPAEPTDDPTGDLMNDQTDFNQYGEQNEPGANDVEVSTDADMGSEDGPMMDDQDFTSDVDDPNATPEDPNMATQTPGKKGPGLEYDSTRKYVLYRNFVSLNNAIENYATKLSDNLSDDIEKNKVYTKAIEKLNEINELCHDYMMMKFELNSYIQSRLFYQNLIVMVQLVFNLLGKPMKKPKK